MQLTSSSYRKQNFTFQLIEGDISISNTDAIVNAANTGLILGAGVAGAIRRRGGPRIQKECNALAPIKTGESVITTGGDLSAKYVIHTAGPVYHNHSKQKAENLLKDCVVNSLKFLERDDINSITFPAISAGIFGFPPESCAEIMISAIKEYIDVNVKEKHTGRIKNTKQILIQICLYGESMYTLFLDRFRTIIKNGKS